MHKTFKGLTEDLGPNVHELEPDVAVERLFSRTLGGLVIHLPDRQVMRSKRPTNLRNPGHSYGCN